MMRRLSAVLLALGLAACGTQHAAPRGPEGQSPDAHGTSSPGATRTIVGTTSVPVAGGGPSRSSEIKATPGTTEPNAANHFAIEFEMAACIERSRPATALVRTARASMIIASAAYADGENHGGLWTGSTDSEGRYSIAWTPPPDAPLGPAQILAGVNGDSGGATARRHFILAAAGGCP
jgi:hypothetical protein